MKTVSIRDLRGADLQESAREGKPLAVTNHRVLVGVIIPVVSAWVEHLIYYNWSHVCQSVAEAEQAVATGSPAIPLEAVLVGKTVVQTPESKETLDQLQTSLNPPESAEQEASPVERQCAPCAPCASATCRPLCSRKRVRLGRPSQSPMNAS